MAVFGLLANNKQAHAKITDIRMRLLQDNFIKNPFVSKIKKSNCDLYVISIKPIWPPLYLMGVFPLLIALVWPGTWYGIISIIITLGMAFIGLWWSSWFYYLLFYWATRGKVKYLSASKTLERVM
jgi:hypothetical protein